MVMVALCATAQEQERPLRKFVVADVETRVPIRNVIVATGDGYRDTTNYRGVCFVPETFDTLTVYKANYLTERLLPRELKDSTFLIPNNRRISEVTVWGDDPNKRVQENADKWTRQDGSIPSSGSGLVIEFDLARMLDKRYRKDMKNLKKTRAAFKKMDETSDDPIVAAYKRALEEKRLQEELKKKAEEEKAEKLKEQQQALDQKKRETEETAKELGQ